MKTKSKRIILGIVILLLVLVGFASCHAIKKKKVKPTTTKLETMVVKLGSISTELQITGEIQPKTTVQIKSKVSGKIVKFYVDENDYVKQGSVICDIEPDYNQANTIAGTRSQLQVAEITLRNAKKDYNDRVKLYATFAVSKKEVDDAKDDLEKATINYNQAKDQYELIKEIDTKGKITKVYATASGTVIQRLVEEGEMVQANNSGYSEGTVLIKLANMQPMVVKSNVNEVDIDKIKQGQTAKVQVDAFPYKEYVGKVIKIAAMATTDENAKVFPVEILLENADSKLRPGMTANVLIKGDSRNNIVTIPIRALFSNDANDDIVYVVTKGNQTQAVNVKTGINDFQNVEIIEGLKVGQVISLSDPAAGAQSASIKVGATISN